MKLFQVVILASAFSIVAGTPQFPATSAELSGNAPGEGGSFQGFFSALLFGGSTPKTPLQSYVAMYGVIHNQIENQLNNAGTAELIKKIETLTHALDGQMTAYMNQVTLFENQSKAADIALNPGQTVVVPVGIVDNAMYSVGSLISGSLDWYQAPQFDPRNPSAFILTGVKGMGSTLCLHTQAGSTKPGTNVAVDTACDLNSYNDKVWGVAPSGQLILRTTIGDMCVTYKSKEGRNQKDHIAIYSILSPACKNGRQIKLLQDKSGLYGLYDDNVMLCINKPRWYQFLDRIPVIVNPTYKECYNDNYLQFSKLPVNINAAGAGGSTGNSLVPALTFDQIGVQVYYFPLIASAHIAALKELYQYGSMKAFAMAQFSAKVKQYMIWLATFVPMFDTYSTFVGIDSTQQINDAMKFFHRLENATIH